MQRASETTPLVETRSVPVVIKPYVYNFKDDMALDSRGIYSRNSFWFLNLGLLSCYLVCGLIIAALSASVENIAENVGRQSTDIASVYVARGIGSIVGSFASAPMLDNMNAVRCLLGTYAACCAVMVWIPLINTLPSLHIAYFLIGGLTSLVSAGSILLLRKIHRQHAGPWLGALGAALVSAGIIVPIVQMVVYSLRYQFFLYAALIALGGVWLKLLPFIPEDVHGSPSSELQAMSMLKLADSSESLASMSESGTDDAFFMTSVSAASGASSSSLYCSLYGQTSPSKHANCKMVFLGKSSRDLISDADPAHMDDQLDIEADAIDSIEQVVHVQKGVGVADAKDAITGEPPHYWTDMFISLMVLFIVGAGTTFSIYLETYVDQTLVVNPHYKAMVLMVFFCSGTVANVSGIFMQISIGDRSLAILCVVILCLGALGVLIILVFPGSPNVLWTGVALFGFSSAITVGFCFNLANRLSYPSATSTSIIMIGSSFGVSILPYVTSLLISYNNFPGMVMLVAMVSMLLPILCLFLAIKCSYVEHKF